MYNDKIMDHFKKPKNMGTIKNPDGVGEVGNTVCGDLMHIYIKVDSKNGKEFIKDIKWETFGCAVAIANTSILSENVKGMPIAEAEKVDKKRILEWVGMVPKEKIHCSLLADEGLQAAIKDYQAKKQMKCDRCDVVANTEKVLKNALKDYRKKSKEKKKSEKNKK